MQFDSVRGREAEAEEEEKKETVATKGFKAPICRLLQSIVFSFHCV